MKRVAALVTSLSVALSACGTSPHVPEVQAGLSGSAALASQAVPGCAAANLAQGKTVTASSTENATSLAARFAVDGDAGTRWASQASDAQWLQVDLGSTQNICGVTLQWEAAYAKTFQLEVSNDGTTWTPASGVVNGTGGTQNVSVTGTGRYIRMTGLTRATGYGYSLFEFQVFGSAAAGTTCTTTNVAQGKTVTASSTENATTLAARFAVDGDAGTRWASQASDAQWLQVDLGSIQNICGVTLQWEAAYAKTFQLEVSNDGTTWTPASGVVNGTGGTQNVSVSASGRYIRMTGLTRATGYGYSLYEFKVFTAGGTGSTLPGGPTVKISGNKRAYASTTQDRGADPAYAIDGNLGTRWSSGSSAKAWLMLDLGAAARIDRVELDWERAWSSRYTLEVSNDRQNWTAVGGVQTNPRVQDGVTSTPPASEYHDTVALNLTQPYRYVRINSTERGWSAGDGSQYGISLYEFAVYGAGGQDNPAVIGGPPAPTGNTWALKWQDEFDSAATPLKVDGNRWNYELGDGCAKGLCGWGNGERQYYTDSLSNVALQNGLLNITARKNDQGHPYTSGRITTAGKYQFTYGRVAARIRMQMPATAAGAKDGAVGVWGAFWMLGFDVDDPYVGWPNAGETDIFENIGYSWWYSSSLHGPGYSGGGSIGESYNKQDTASGIALNGHPDFKTTDWHTYQAQWDADQIVFSIDDVPYRTVSRAETEQRGYWVFNRPNYIILNVAYDGAYPAAYRNNAQNFTGARTADGLAQLAENNFPHTMQVDWVRVYQRQ
ncbi:discoidin domain-containing protein [Deinococcus hopiensis]|uniref:Beta-glucanase/Beta-glucan synthetase n=1 Tax=Deinococcus hopiensis KR-140 TaxID=695939 RepID=A0A1W1UQ98_9DEIO|nr:discoidin domain-containing protein [Deinococcus hopiensis]SMB83318.1 Beta-glucanase/Beta-glucan synthetase [Deinococcus hopiensis KR-140]